MEIINQIIKRKEEELKKRKQGFFQSPSAEIEKAPFRTLLKKVQTTPFSIIAETKRSSPSTGILAPDYNPVAIARQYQAGGAAAISVLTESSFFLGSLQDLTSVKNAVSLPVLAKDFFIDPLQIEDAASAGADIVLIILRIAGSRLLDLIESAEKNGIEALVEVHTPFELETALSAITGKSHCILGINNRNLHTLQTDLSTTFNLISQIKNDTIPVISESGITNPDTIERLFSVGIRGALIGTHLMRAKNPSAEIKTLLRRIA
ncbi:MAG: indole-3-glycerol phosphate synthase TrpC [Candidatus Ratteibacteria bacterium]